MSKNTVEKSILLSDNNSKSGYDGTDNPYLQFIAETEAKPRKAESDGNLTLFGGAMAFVSTIIGGGIVGLPYSFYHAGIPMALILNFVFMLLTIYSCYLVLEARNMVGNLK